MNRTAGGGALGHDPIASVLSDRDKRAAARADPRAGVRDRAQPRCSHNRHGRRAHRRPGRRPPRDLRRRVARAPEGGQARGSEGRSAPGGLMADVVEKRPVARPLRRRGQAGRRYSGRFALAHLLVVVAFAGVLVLFAYLVSQSNAPGSLVELQAHGRRDVRRERRSMANHVAPRYLSGGESDRGRPGPAACSSMTRSSTGSPSPVPPLPGRGRALSRSSSRRAIDDGLRLLRPGAALRPRGTGAEDVVPLLRRGVARARAVHLQVLARHRRRSWPSSRRRPSRAPRSTFRRRNLEAELSKPLEQTLPSRDVITASSMRLRVERRQRSIGFERRESAARLGYRAPFGDCARRLRGLWRVSAANERRPHDCDRASAAVRTFGTASGTDRRSSSARTTARPW